MIGSKIDILKIRLPINLYLYKPYPAIVPITVATTVVAEANIELAEMQDFRLNIYNAEHYFEQEEAFQLRVGRKPLLVVNFDETDLSFTLLTHTFDSLNVSYDLATDITTDIMHEYQIVFMLTGTIAGQYNLSDIEILSIENYLNDNGRMYLEGAKVWANEHNSGLDYIFGIQAATVGFHEYETLIGNENSMLEGFSFDYNLEGVAYGDYNFDKLEPIGNGQLIMKYGEDEKGITISNQMESYRTIGSGCLLGGLHENGNGEIAELIQKYLSFFNYKANTLGIENPLTNNYSLNVYPNPFSDKTSIQFDLIKDTFVKLNIYDLQGRLIKVLLNNELQSGKHKFLWNKTDLTGGKVQEGIYFYKLEIGKDNFVGKLITLN